MSADLCKLCHGLGNRFVSYPEGFQWWECQGCGGAGTRTTTTVPPTIKLGKAQSRLLKALPNEEAASVRPDRRHA